ncbi:hypothetical protein CNEO3_560034 [Clostridium neonatale]|nr:hypothetical protein CNEO3_560034 [Clostridium neonatale]CAI3732609.1 hypothetical protein CNEO4_960035 [Clostridium neonatale]
MLLIFSCTLVCISLLLILKTTIALSELTTITKIIQKATKNIHFPLLISIIDQLLS